MICATDIIKFSLTFIEILKAFKISESKTHIYRTRYIHKVCHNATKRN